jgi:zinc and cadmium transporter
MNTAYVYAILSVVVVSMISLVGVFTLSHQSRLSHKSIRFMVSFAVGALLGDVFIHLIPELAEKGNLNLNTSLIILASIVGFFITESFIQLHRHHTEPDEVEHAHHPVAYLNLIGDGLHNLIDGLIIGAAYLIDIQAGIATTIAVILHEIPQEIGDYGILLYAGFSKSKALFYNFMSAIVAMIGVVLALLVGEIENFATILVAIGIGSFIYISLADLVPEIHKSKAAAFSQFLTIMLGIAVMSVLLVLE